MKHLILTGVVAGLLFTSCSKDGDINFFTVKQDLEFGAQLDAEILATPKEYPVLDKAANPEAYAYVEGMLAEILKSDEINYRSEFKWQVRIINANVMNAFAAPGGYLYFYTGIMKYLNTGAALAGVMAHEVAHADRRHSTETMTKAYGFSVLLNVVLGKGSGASILKDLASGAANLKFSRTHEYEADEYSVKYLATSPSHYNPIGIRVFFDQLAADGKTGSNFEFLSTHPTDEHRVENIMSVYSKIGSPAGDDKTAEHKAIIAKLP